MWYVVSGTKEYGPDEGEGDHDANIWTLSRDQNTPGWRTDGGYDGYGLTKKDAEELASAANAIAERRGDTGVPSGVMTSAMLDAGVTILRANYPPKTDAEAQGQELVLATVFSRMCKLIPADGSCNRWSP